MLILFCVQKFAESVNINVLPDKGAKVHQSIEELETKIASLEKKLAKYSQKTNTPVRLNTLKIKEESKEKPLVQKNFVSLLSDDEMNIKKEMKNSYANRESHVNKDPASTDQLIYFDVDEIPKVPQTTFKTDDLGKKALETLNKQQSLTTERLEKLHGSLTSRPAEDQKEKDPAGLKVRLMDHQQHALAWMKWRENQKPRGGILGISFFIYFVSFLLVESLKV